MISANVEAAKFLAANEMPTLYRVHETPKAEKLKALREFLSELGLDSVFVVNLMQIFEGIIQQSLDPTILFDFATIGDFAAYLAKEYCGPSIFGVPWINANRFPSRSSAAQSKPSYLTSSGL